MFLSKSILDIYFSFLLYFLHIFPSFLHSSKYVLSFFLISSLAFVFARTLTVLVFSCHSTKGLLFRTRKHFVLNEMLLILILNQVFKGRRQTSPCPGLSTIRSLALFCNHSRREKYNFYITCFVATR